MKETSWGNLHGENDMGEFARGKLPWGKKCMGKNVDGGNCDTRLKMPRVKKDEPISNSTIKL